MSPVSLATPDLSPVTADARWAAPSFEAVYRAHVKTVARWAMRLVGPQGDFEDVVHEVFLVVRRRLPEFRGEAEITTWLYEITVRVAQGFRKRARWWSWLTGRGRNPSRGQVREVFLGATEGTTDPHSILEARERTRFLYRLLDELSEDQRTTFILFELEGLSGEQIAEITGASVGSVWVRLSRARRKFMDRMREWEEREAR
jgi:RNA polymerase sigma-70 factor, ECF subfamily